VARKKTAITLNKLTPESTTKLKSMVAELTGDKGVGEGSGAKPSRWSRRFAASGKIGGAPKIRLS